MGSSKDGSVELKAFPKDEESAVVNFKANDSPQRLTSLSADNDPNLVQWDGVNDEENPQNWPKSKKNLYTVFVCLLVHCATFGSSMIAPAIPTIEQKFGVNREIATLTLSLVVLGWATGPLVFAPASEIYGRSIVYKVSWLAFVLLNVGSADSQNIASLVICRFFSGIFGGAAITIAPASGYDIYDQNEVGPPAFFIAVCAFMGTVMGPVCGGYITEYAGWRWVLWVSTIYSGILLVPVMFAPETHGHTCLAKKAGRLRRENGVPTYYTAFDRYALPKSTIFATAIWRPIQLLVLEPVILFTSLLVSVVWGILYVYMGAYLYVFEGIYGWGPGNAGAAFGGIGVGILLSILVSGPANKIYLKQREKYGNGGPYPEGRLPPAMVAACLIPISVFWFAWTGFKNVPWIVPILSGIPFGLGMTLLFISFVTYTADGFPTVTASATAANYLLRALFSFAFPLFTPRLYGNLAPKWAETIFGCISLLFIPLPFILYKYGPGLRARSRFVPKYT